MASPAACYKLFREKQKEGQGEATMFKGKGTAGGFGPGSRSRPAGQPTRERQHLSDTRVSIGGTFAHPAILQGWPAGWLPTTPRLLEPYFGKASGMGGIKPFARRGRLPRGMERL